MTDAFDNARRAADILGPAMDRAGGPLGLVGRVVGLGEDEIAAGVPKWAWLGIGVISGAILMYVVYDRVEAFVGD